MSFKSENNITLSFQPSKKFFGCSTVVNPVIALLALLFIISSCSKSVYQNIDRGGNYMYREGYPEVRMSAIGLFNEQGEPGIEVSANIVYASLVYEEVENQQTANITIEVRMVRSDSDTEDGSADSTVTESYNVTVAEHNQDMNLPSSQDVFSFHKRYSVSPGEYTVYLTVIDQSSRQHTTRQTTTYIPVTDVQHPVLTSIQILGKDNSWDNASYTPLTTYDVQSKLDSLKFRFQVTNGDPDSPVTIQSELIRFDSDTTYARSMSRTNPSPSTIAYQGIEYDETEVIQSSRRILNQTGSVLVEFVFPMQERGNYRFSARTVEGDNENQQYKARDFGIKSANYPTVKTPEELARPLVYLMNDDQYEDMMKIGDSDSLKQAIDTFWLKNVGNKSRAKQVIELYYQRVEEANKQFSNFKEGWKTDPGMMYILFGPPLDYEERLDTMTWYYSYNREDPRETFRFYQPKLEHEAYPFEHYLLQRNFYYNNLQYQQIQRWLSGLVLSGR